MDIHQGREFLNEFSNFIHESDQVGADSIPLEEGEFSIVPGAGLAGSKSMCQLKDRSAPGREESFHGQFGRGLQIASGVFYRDFDRINVRIDDRFSREERSVGLPEASIPKELSDLLGQRGSSLEELDSRGREGILREGHG